jgi:hypothetical protein
VYDNDDVAVLDPTLHIARGYSTNFAAARCCACWSRLVTLVDYRNSDNNLPFFRIGFFCSTVAYLVMMLGVAAGEHYCLIAL